MKKELIERVNAGIASEEDFEAAEQLIAKGEINPMEISSYSRLYSQLKKLPEPAPSKAMSANFYKSLSEESGRKDRKGWNWSVLLNFSRFGQIAFSMLLLAAGFWVGTEYSQKNTSDEINTLAGEVIEMKELMMLSLLDQQSTSQRLKAVNIVNELPDASDKICNALLTTLKQDENANVRRAALEALIPYTDKASVRKGLIDAISVQESPMVILAISEIMVLIQEKSAVDELEKLLEKQETPEDIKMQLRQNINTLI